MDRSTGTGHRQGSYSSPFHSGRVLSFQSGPVSGPTEMLSVDLSRYAGGNDLASTLISGSTGISNHIAAVLPAQTPSRTVVQPMPKFRHVMGSPAYWSARELETLHEGLLRYANDTNVKKYTKIAALLPNKTIRDVAMRCQRMTNVENISRRKASDHHAAKRMKTIKMVGPLSTSSTANAPTQNVYHNQLIMHGTHPISQFPLKALDGEFEHFLVENDDLLIRISDNINKGQMQENINIFLAMKKNIDEVKDRIDMLPATVNQLPGIMEPMPPFPVSINKEILDILSSTGNDVYSASGSSHLPPDSSYFIPNIG